MGEKIEKFCTYIVKTPERPGYDICGAPADWWYDGMDGGVGLSCEKHCPDIEQDQGEVEFYNDFETLGDYEALLAITSGRVRASLMTAIFHDKVIWKALHERPSDKSGE